MIVSSKTFVYTTPRHLKFMFFVDSKISLNVLREIVHGNLRIWGGRYNPIVPVYNNKIDETYLDLIKRYDPDIIYLTENIDIKIIKALNLFNPKNYKILTTSKSTQPMFFAGVDCHTLLDQSLRQYSEVILLQIQESFKINIPTKSFYQTNFALFDLLQGQETKQFKSALITKDNATEINKIISETKPYFKSLLPQLYEYTTVCRPSDSNINAGFEFVIYEANNALNDFLYFWNRQLYIGSNWKLNQIIASKEEFEILIKDKYFENLLYDLATNSNVTLVSQSIKKKELEKLKNSIQSVFKRIQFGVSSKDNFPYAILDSHHSSVNFPVERTKHVIIGKSDLLKLPKPSFMNAKNNNGSYMVDVEIERDNNDEQRYIQLPYKNFICDFILEQAHTGRINLSHNISLLVSDIISTVDLKILSDFELIQLLLLFREENGKVINTPIKQVRLSNAGQKLSAFNSLFNGNWSNIESYIEEKFWLQLFRYDSDFRDESDIRKGRGIFSYKSLLKEQSLIYEKNKLKIKKDNKIKGEKQLATYIEHSKKEDIEWYIDYGLQELVNKGILFIGMKVKCENCGSNKWYSLDEASNKVACKGCNNYIIPEIETPFYYKLNEIVINNLISDPTSNSKEFDGNYIVLKTLLRLKKDCNGYIRSSFLYCPPLDYGDRDKWTGDIDIISIQNGEFIIGEAKSQAKDFNKKEIKSLIWLGENLRPDKIILAYNSGKFDKTKIAEIKKGMKTHTCEIVDFQISKSWYHFRGMFGLE